jgi:hypothetical protein
MREDRWNEYMIDEMKHTVAGLGFIADKIAVAVNDKAALTRRAKVHLFAR